MTIETVVVAGASGETGRELLNELRTTELGVKAMTRDPANVETLERLGADEVVIGNLLDQADADRAVSDVDAVLCAVGTKPGLGALGDEFVDGQGVVNLADAASEAGIERFVFESSLGVGDAKEGLPLPARVAIAPILRAKDRAESHLRESGLAYTILRPGMLTNDPPSGAVVVGEGGDSVSGSISRADVARLMIASLFTSEAENRTFEIVNQEGLRGTPKNTVELTWTEPSAAV